MTLDPRAPLSPTLRLRCLPPACRGRPAGRPGQLSEGVCRVCQPAAAGGHWTGRVPVRPAAGRRISASGRCHVNVSWMPAGRTHTCGRKCWDCDEYAAAAAGLHPCMAGRQLAGALPVASGLFSLSSPPCKLASMHVCIQQCYPQQCLCLL